MHFNSLSTYYFLLNPFHYVIFVPLFLFLLISSIFFLFLLLFLLLFYILISLNGTLFFLSFLKLPLLIPHFESIELQLQFLVGRISHHSHIHNNIEGSHSNDRPAKLILKLRVIYELCEHEQVVGSAHDAQFVENFQLVERRILKRTC